MELREKCFLFLAGALLLLPTVTLAKKGGNKPGSEAAHYVRADLPDVDDPSFGLFSDTVGQALSCLNGGPFDYAHRDEADCTPAADRLWVRSDVSAGERWMFGAGHDFQTPGDIATERKVGVDFSWETDCDVPGGDCYADKTNSEGQSLEDRLIECEENGNGCVSLGDGRAWLAYANWTMDKVLMAGVNRHELSVYFQQVGDGEWAGLTHLEYINPLYVCEDSGLGADFRVVQTWECGCTYGGQGSCGDVSEAEVRIGNPGVKKKADRSTVVGRFSIPTQMTIQMAGPILP